jgi:plastocyanin
MRRVWFLLAVALLLAGCADGAPTTSRGEGSSPTGQPGTAGVVEVRLTCATGDPDAPCAFSPAEASIRTGGTVRWVNDDATYHTVTSSDRLSLVGAENLIRPGQALWPATGYVRADRCFDAHQR